MRSRQTLKERLQMTGPVINENKIALTDLNQSLSYKELLDTVSAMSRWLLTNDVAMLALHSDNSIDWVLVDLACQQAGVTCIPLPDFFSQEQLKNCLKDTLVDLVFTNSPSSFNGILNKSETLASPCSLEAIKLFPQLRHRDLSVSDQRCPTHTQKITFTSGSTGAPKGVCLSADHQWTTATSLADTINIDQPKHLCLLPLGTLLENIAGIYAPLLSNGSIVLPSCVNRGLNGSSGLDIKQLLSCISTVQPNTLILIPQLLNALVMACQQGWVAPKSLKFIAVGGAKVSAQLLATAHGLGLPIYEGYGLSECCSVVALNTPVNNKQGFVGKPLPHCRVSTAGKNIVVLEPVFQGYYDDKESWYQKEVYTGDLGSFNDGYLSVDGRDKNVIISSFGRNINPEWVESELLGKPLLSQCVVLGENRPHLVALLSAPEFISDEQIEDWVCSVNSQLPDYAKVGLWERLTPDQWTGALTANGRPQRQKINTLFAQRIEQLYQRPQLANSELAKNKPNLNECI